MAHSIPPSLDSLAQSDRYPVKQTSLNHTDQSTIDMQGFSDSPLNRHSNNHSHQPMPAAQNAPLRVHVERVVREYFAALGDEMPTDFYELILKEVELPLLTVVLEQTRGNQTKCAQILGLNRGTLRKKLKTYNLM